MTLDSAFFLFYLICAVESICEIIKHFTGYQRGFVIASWNYNDGWKWGGKS